MSTPTDFEKLGAFYLGKMHDLATGETRDDLLLYDAKDLTTHAVCVGMTGSGKTGLCCVLLEEAAIDGIPAIIIDPKGDLGNLALAFPRLRGSDFEPWVDPGEAKRKGMSTAEYATNRAQLWKKGLGGWGQDGERIARFRDAVDLAIYTPGSDAGLPISVLRSFDAPSEAIINNRDAMRDRVLSATSGLLALLGRDADPIQSREHILLSNILDHHWRQGRNLDLAAIIQAIQAPPFDRVGVFDLDSFFPAKDRFSLAMAVNSLLASPGFATWMEGEPLNIDRLLYTPEGKPRISILSIAHLSDPERMFFVTLLLNEVVTWMRGQSGTTSLRALLYMDEVFGFFPPVANPPSKAPMLTLMKQARAFGLGCVLATQNPVDLDYKGLSNAGTWFLGRLQTERDKKRVLEGLEGASAQAGSTFDKTSMDATLAALGSRVFLMNNVHEDEPAIFHTRWALSYLRGPLTRQHIEALMATKKRLSAMAAPIPAPGEAPPRVGRGSAGPKSAPATAPILPPGVKQQFVDEKPTRDEGELRYRPALLGHAKMHYVRASAKIDDWVEVALLAMLDEDMIEEPWDEAESVKISGFDLRRRAEKGATFAPLPAAATNAKQFPRWERALKSFLYEDRVQSVWHCRALKEYSVLGLTEGEFRIRLREAVREKRDLEVEKLRKRFAPKLRTLQERLRKAEQKVDREAAQARQSGLSTAVTLGTSVLGALFGRKTSRSAGSTIRGAGRTVQQRGDVGRAKEDVRTVSRQLEDLESEFQQAVEEARDLTVDDLDLAEISLSPRKSDMSIKAVGILWLPYLLDEDGEARPAFEWPGTE